MIGRVPLVVAVCAASTHAFSKPVEAEVTLVAGYGVLGDAHAGVTVRHRSRVRRDPTQPNLRQVHLIAAELHEELCGRGFLVGPGDLGENITTQGVDLLSLPVDTLLHLGADAVVRVTGLRNPCSQLDQFQQGLTAAVLERAKDGRVVRRAGVMAVVASGGVVRAGDPIDVTLPAPPHRPLNLV